MGRSKPATTRLGTVRSQVGNRRGEPNNTTAGGSGSKIGPTIGPQTSAPAERLLEFAGDSRSGRQDLNLRPPGPQPERSSRARSDSALYSGLSCSEWLSVALNLAPGLDPAERAPKCGRSYTSDARHLAMTTDALRDTAFAPGALPLTNTRSFAPLRSLRRPAADSRTTTFCLPRPLPLTLALPSRRPSLLPRSSLTGR